MGLISGALSRIGYKKVEVEQKNMTTAADAFTSTLGSTLNAGFSTFNNQKQQLNSYTEWVYAATSTIAEHCAAVDLRLFQNHTKIKNLALAQKLIDHPKEALKLKQRKMSFVENKGGRLTLRKDVSALEELESHPLLDLLNAPNPFMSKNEFFEIAFIHLQLTGDAFWAIHRDKKGVPDELWPLMPNQMQVVPDKTHFIVGYIYTVNGVQVPFDPNDIIHHKYGNPTDFRHGYSAVQAAATTIDSDAHAGDFNRKFFYNSATPDGILSTDSSLDDDTYKRLKTEWQDAYGGDYNAHRTAILEAGVDYKAISVTQRDMEFIQGRNWNRDQILAVFGVPKSVLGLDESMSRANAEAVEYVFTKRNRVKMQRLVNRITMDLAVQFDPTLVISFTDPVPEDKEFLLKETQAALGSSTAIGWATINEERAKRGDDPVEAGDAILIPGTVIALGTPEDEPLPEKIDADVQEEADSPDLDDSDEEEGGDGGKGSASNNSTADSSGSTSSDTTNSSSDASKSIAWEPSIKTADPLPDFPPAIPGAEVVSQPSKAEPEVSADANPKGGKDRLNITPEMEKWFRQRDHSSIVFQKQTLNISREHFLAQKQEVLANLHQQFNDKSLKAITDMPKGNAKNKAAKQKIGNLFDKVASAALWVAALTPVYKAITAKSAAQAVALVNNPAKFGYAATAPATPIPANIGEEDAATWAEQRAATIPPMIDAETDKQIRASIIEGINNGENLGELSDRIENIYGAAAGYRSQRIAVNESASAMQYSSQMAWDQSGLVDQYIWITGPNPCEECESFDGATADTPDDFPDGPPQLHINCMCDCVPYNMTGDQTDNTDGNDNTDNTDQTDQTDTSGDNVDSTDTLGDGMAAISNDKVVTKYSPDQEREPNGEFGSGGGSDKPAWKPSGTPAEAAAFAAGSKLTGTYYHGTNTTAANKIQASGFKPSGTVASNTSSAFPGTIMLTSDESDAKWYAKSSDSSGKGNVLSTRVNVDSVARVSRSQFDNLQEAAAKESGLPMWDRTGAIIEANYNKASADALNKLFETNSAVIYDKSTLMVQDPKTIMVSGNNRG